MFNLFVKDQSIESFFENIEGIFQEITHEADISLPLNNFLKLINDFFDIEKSRVYLFFSKKLTYITSDGEDTELSDLEINEDDERKLIASNKGISEEELSYYSSLFEINSSMTIKYVYPLVYSNNLIGVVTLGQKKINEYSKVENTIFNLISNYISKKIFYSISYLEESQKNSPLSYLKSITDSLTGTYYKAYIQQRLTEGVKEAVRYKKDYSLLILSIDKYIEISEKYGQQAINLVLQNAGNIINSMLRKGVDLAGRFHEDRFILLLPSTPKKGAIIFSERLRGRLSRLSIPKYSSLDITVSLGLTSLEEKVDKSQDDLIIKSVGALEHSIKVGGNKLSYNYEGLVSENLSDFEKATGISSNLVVNSFGDNLLKDADGNDIDFTKKNVTRPSWMNKKNNK